MRPYLKHDYLLIWANTLIGVLCAVAGIYKAWTVPADQLASAGLLVLLALVCCLIQAGLIRRLIVRKRNGEDV